MILAFRVEQNPGDEKTGKHEEKIDTDPAILEDVVERLLRGVSWTCTKPEMAEHYHQNRDAAQSVELGDMCASLGRCSVRLDRQNLPGTNTLVSYGTRASLRQRASSYCYLGLFLSFL
jgi:hypothetical protein